MDECEINTRQNYKINLYVENHELLFCGFALFCFADEELIAVFAGAIENNQALFDIMWERFGCAERLYYFCSRKYYRCIR